MFRNCRRSFVNSTMVAISIATLLSTGALAQPTLSVDFQGPSAFGGVLDPAAALLAAPGPGPVPPPVVVLSSGALGIGPANFGLRELDALSWGVDTPLRPNSSSTSWRTGYRILLSTDEFANGDPLLLAPPDLFSEGTLGNTEASADLLIATLLPGQMLAPLGPGAPFLGHRSWLDGDGIAPFGGFGLGLIEGNPPSMGFLPDVGDTVDAADFRGPQPRLYFSLDARFTDPLEAPNANIGTAASNGVLPGDVLISGGGGGFGVWASAVQLGLGSQDDVDALALWENGDGIFTPSIVPFDWVGGGTDMLLFSLRRDSPLIGTPDAFTGTPIAEGDILTTPPLGPGTPPGIFIAAEVVGLGTTRSGTAFAFPYGDDLNALSIR